MILSKPVAPLVVADVSGRCADHSRPILSRVLDATNHRGSSIKLVRGEPGVRICPWVTGGATTFAARNGDHLTAERWQAVALSRYISESCRWLAESKK